MAAGDAAACEAHLEKESTTIPLVATEPDTAI
jgi:hypothetical protein